MGLLQTSPHEQQWAGGQAAGDGGRGTGYLQPCLLHLGQVPALQSTLPPNPHHFLT